MISLDDLQTDVNKVASIMATFGVMEPKVEAAVQGGLLIASAVKRLVQGVATNPDGSPITDAQYAAHLVAAGTANAAVIAEAIKDLTEDKALHP